MKPPLMPIGTIVDTPVADECCGNETTSELVARLAVDFLTLATVDPRAAPGDVFGLRA